jgi:hypothetical protein
MPSTQLSLDTQTMNLSEQWAKLWVDPVPDALMQCAFCAGLLFLVRGVHSGARDACVIRLNV